MEEGELFVRVLFWEGGGPLAPFWFRKTKSRKENTCCHLYASLSKQNETTSFTPSWGWRAMTCRPPDSPFYPWNREVSAKAAIRPWVLENKAQKTGKWVFFLFSLRAPPFGGS